MGRVRCGANQLSIIGSHILRHALYAVELMYHRSMEQGRDMRAALKLAKEEASRIPEERKRQHTQRFDAAQCAAQAQATFHR